MDESDNFVIELIKRKRLEQILAYLKSSNAANIKINIVEKPGETVNLTPQYSQSFNCVVCVKKYENNIVYKSTDNKITKCLDCLLMAISTDGKNINIYNDVINDIPKNIGEGFFEKVLYKSEINCSFCKKLKIEFFCRTIISLE